MTENQNMDTSLSRCSNASARNSGVGVFEIWRDCTEETVNPESLKHSNFGKSEMQMENMFTMGEENFSWHRSNLCWFETW